MRTRRQPSSTPADLSWISLGPGLSWIQWTLTSSATLESVHDSTSYVRRRCVPRMIHRGRHLSVTQRGWPLLYSDVGSGTVINRVYCVIVQEVEVGWAIAGSGN